MIFENKDFKIEIKDEYKNDIKKLHDIWFEIMSFAIKMMNQPKK